MNRGVKAGVFVFIFLLLSYFINFQEDFYSRRGDVIIHDQKENIKRVSHEEVLLKKNNEKKREMNSSKEEFIQQLKIRKNISWEDLAYDMKEESSPEGPSSLMADEDGFWVLNQLKNELLYFTEGEKKKISLPLGNYDLSFLKEDSILLLSREENKVTRFFKKEEIFEDISFKFQEPSGTITSIEMEGNEIFFELYHDKVVDKEGKEVDFGRKIKFNSSYRAVVEEKEDKKYLIFKNKDTKEELSQKEIGNKNIELLFLDSDIDGHIYISWSEILWEKEDPDILEEENIYFLKWNVFSQKEQKIKFEAKDLSLERLPLHSFLSMSLDVSRGCLLWFFPMIKEAKVLDVCFEE